MFNNLIRLSTIASVILIVPCTLQAQQILRISPDTTVVLGGLNVADQVVAEDDLGGGITLPDLGILPAGTDLTAYHQLLLGDQLLAFDTTVEVGGVLVEPGDVVRFDGFAFALEFDASNEGLPAGTYVDAVSADPMGLVLSFDTTVDFGAFFADDADLVRFDGVGFTLFFDAMGVGVPAGLDLDGVHLLANDTFLLSFDTSGSLGGFAFDDEDILGFDPATWTWSLVYDGSTEHEEWSTADLDAISTPIIGQPALIPTLNGKALLLMMFMVAMVGLFAMPRSRLS